MVAYWPTPSRTLPPTKEKWREGVATCRLDAYKRLTTVKKF